MIKPNEPVRDGYTKYMENRFRERTEYEQKHGVEMPEHLQEDQLTRDEFASKYPLADIPYAQKQDKSSGFVVDPAKPVVKDKIQSKPAKIAAKKIFVDEFEQPSLFDDAKSNDDFTK